LVNLQFIDEAGNKRFLAGGLKKGCFHVLGSETGTILICEGFATGASLFDTTGFLTVIAFDCGNLEHVAIEIRKLYPNAEIVIAGDNDLSVIGQQKAIEAALAVSGKYILPATLGHDWNDSLTMEVDHV
jgi:putative DNA primase/helicase